MKILDRYIFRELIPPFFIGMGLFTFVLVMNTLLDLARMAIRGNVAFADVAQILLYSLPHIFALTIPMSVLLAVNLGLGRMSADNEITVLHASGVGLLRIGRAIGVFAVISTLATGYILIRLVPKANQRARTLVYQIAKRQFQQGIRPKEFYEGFASYVIFTSSIDEDTNVWRDIMVCDMSVGGELRLIFSRQGRMKYNESEKYVILELQDGESFSLVQNDPEKSSWSTFTVQKLLFSLDRFGDAPVQPGEREMGLGALAREVQKRKLMNARWRPFAVEFHKKLAIPVACLVFGVIGVAIGARNRTRGQSAGFVVSLAILMIYYILLTTGERLGDQGDLSPWFSMWMANILIGGAGLWMLFLAAREIDLGIWDRALTIGIRLFQSLGRRKGRRGAGGISVRRPRGKRTIVIRIPRFSPDFPRILDRYALREWLQTFAVILVAIVALYILVDFSRILNDISQNETPMQTVVDYYEYSLPYISFLVLGPTALTTTLLILGVMNRNNEIIAMKASGVSIYRIVMPVVLVALTLSVAAFFVNDRVIPSAMRKALDKRDEITKGPKRTHEYDYNRSRWIWGEGNRRLYNYQAYHPDTAAMDNVRVFELDQSVFTLHRVVAGHRATYDEGSGWVFESGAEIGEAAWVRRFERGEASPYKRADRIAEPYPERPDYFVTEKKASDELNIMELRDYIRSLEAAGYATRSLKVNLEWKYSLPFSTLVMTIIGIPFALKIGKRGNLFGVAVSVALITTFWIMTAAFRPLGETGLFPPVLSAWAPNIVFGVSGGYLLLTLDT
ncbi:MAG: LPS export ABC transporter permease LptF [Acidobacteriota bacterium]